MQAIRVGIQLAPQHCPYARLARAAREVEEAGFDTLWVWDHFFPMYGIEGAPLGSDLPAGDVAERGYHFEAWTLLTAMACLTRRVEVGVLVSGNSYRNPQLLADMARTLDHVSGGRAILGIGSGWYAKDYLEYGYELGSPAERLAHLGRDLQLIERRLEQLSPPPLRRPMPLMIGGGGEKVTLRLTARHARMWNGAGRPDVLAHKVSVLRQWCEKEGRDPDEIEKSAYLFKPEQLEQLDAYHEAGITHFIMGLGLPFDLRPALRVLEWARGR